MINDSTFSNGAQSSETINVAATRSTESFQGLGYHRAFQDNVRGIVRRMLHEGAEDVVVFPIGQRSASEFHAIEIGGARTKGDGMAVIVADMAGRPAQICRPGRPQAEAIHGEMRISIGFHVIMAAKDSGTKQMIALYEVEDIRTKEDGGYDNCPDPKDEMFAAAKLTLVHAGRTISDFKDALIDDERKEALMLAIQAASRKMMTVECSSVSYGQLLEIVKKEVGESFRTEVMTDNWALDDDETLLANMTECFSFSSILQDLLRFCHRQVAQENRKGNLKSLNLAVVAYSACAKEETDEGQRLVPYMVLAVYARRSAKEAWQQVKTTNAISYEGLVDFLTDTYGQEVSNVFTPKDIYDADGIAKRYGNTAFCRVLRYTGTYPFYVTSRYDS